MLNEKINNYVLQVQKGDIKEAYQGIITYMRQLKKYLKINYFDYNVSSNFYQGLMDITFFTIAPKLFLKKSLKIAIVYIHEHNRFEFWLTARNKSVKQNYNEVLTNLTLDNRYILGESNSAVLLKTIAISKPDFDNPIHLHEQILVSLLEFINKISEIIT